MKRSTLLLVLFSVLPSYIALLADTGLAIGIVFISTLIGLVMTCSLAEEFDEKKYVIDMVRLGWIIHLLGSMIVYGVHQCL